MPDQQTIKQDLKDGIAGIEKLKSVLQKAKAMPDVAIVSRRPGIEMLIHACDFLSHNVEILFNELMVE